MLLFHIPVSQWCFIPEDMRWFRRDESVFVLLSRKHTGRLHSHELSATEITTLIKSTNVFFLNMTMMCCYGILNFIQCIAMWLPGCSGGCQVQLLVKVWVPESCAGVEIPGNVIFIFLATKSRCQEPSPPQPRWKAQTHPARLEKPSSCSPAVSRGARRPMKRNEEIVSLSGQRNRVFRTQRRLLFLKPPVK